MYFSRLKGESLKDTKVFTGASLLVAITVVLNFFRIIISNTNQILFSYLGVAAAGFLYGPIIGGLVGGLADILGFYIKPSGPFFIGFTINAILSGVIYGAFLYKKKPTILRILICSLVEGIIINIILTPIWLNIMYGTALFAVPRVVKFLMLLPLKVVLIYFVTNILCRIKRVNN